METLNISIDIDELRSRRFIFDSTNPNWSPNKEHNLFFIKTMENLHNDILRARGFVLLNDLTDQLGMVRSLEGALVGWLISFHQPWMSIEIDVTPRDEDNSLLLSFNVQGIIIEKFEPAHTLSVAHYNIAHQEQ